MIPKGFKEDLLKVKNGTEYMEFREKYKNTRVPFTEFDEEMRQHFDYLITGGKRENPDIHEEVHRKR